MVAVREATATSRRLRTRSKSAKVRVLEKKQMLKKICVSELKRYGVYYNYYFTTFLFDDMVQSSFRVYLFLSVEFAKLEADVYVLQLQRFQVRRHVVVPGFSSETNVEVYSP